jgi:diguanylate cyclase (GGDEF)-like protein
LLVGDVDDNVLELATLTLGALVALVLGINPWLVPLVLPPLLVLHRAVLVDQLEEAAATDGKTGLLNAHTWGARAEHQLRTGAAGVPHAVLVLDLDHFKAVNDLHGHLAGDEVLAAVAKALRSEVRERDLVGRFGGEEFVVLLVGQREGGEADLGAIAERIRERVAGLVVEVTTGDGAARIEELSVSVGGALHSGGRADLDGLLRIADTALYSAKRAGRNQVRMGRTGVDTA